MPGMVKKLKIAVVLFFSAVGVLACSKADAPKTGYVIADSKAIEASIFRQNCAICHGVEANGKMVSGVQVPSLRYGDAATRSREEIYNQIRNGKMPMPAFKNQLSEQDIQKMVDFVMRDLQGRR